MLSLTTDQMNTLIYGPAALYTCADFNLDSGNYYFWDGPEPVTIDSKDYLCIGGFAGVSGVSHAAELGASGIVFELDASRLLAASGDISDPGDWLSSIISDGGYRQRPMRMSYSIWNADTGVHVLQRRAFSGVIDQMAVRVSTNAQGEGAAKLIVRCESISLRYGQRLGRIRSHDDQREIHPTDDFFKFTAGSIAREQTLDWGKKQPKANNNTGHGSAQFSRGLFTVAGRI